MTTLKSRAVSFRHAGKKLIRARDVINQKKTTPRRACEIHVNRKKYAATHPFSELCPDSFVEQTSSLSFFDYYYYSLVHFATPSVTCIKVKCAATNVVAV
jgi:hypothetical protein